MAKDTIRNMEEFAAVSGISRPTVSKYFNDPESVRQSTRQRIEDALEKYDYRPNIYAINQNRKLTKNLGIVVPYLADPFFAELARNIEQRCVAAGFRPTLYSSYGDPDRENDILDSLRSLKPAGVLLAPLGRTSNQAVIEKFCNDVPTILFDSFIPDVGLGFVGSDNSQFGPLIVEYLCRTGEPPSFLEMKTPANPNANKRRHAYINAMEQSGHEPQVVQVDGEGWHFEEIGRSEGGKALAAGLFKSNTVLCSNDRLAIGFLTACYEQNVRVGRDSDCQIRVAGQDDHPFSRFTCPPLTTIAQDYDAISRCAVETLFKAIEGSENKHETRLFEGRLVMRDSA
ncbi:LacI family DNA-binding transcriptional regulator [Actibacterium pelagium]|uniref:LacI family transcriptional regulator n=1 Tax=Actibacterium pelagium TaxID=2029103 RepID=A0A917AQ96_9RHOB|nr:LacI family DNA-binding transcriptional regulator [Actibacterium pelagium]GGE62642.1 LacI family transcriptional regulator [Actibacterium pelagium]